MMKNASIYTYILLLVAVLLYSCMNKGSEEKAVVMENIATDSVSMAESRADEAIPDSLSREKLEGYMEIAGQKLKDYADYMSIVVDQNLKAEFRKKAEEQAMGLFIEHGREEGHDQWTWPDSLMKELSGYQLKIVIDSIRTSEFPAAESESSYHGALTFRQTITGKPVTKKGTAVTKIKRYAVGIIIVRTEKKFGNETREVWEVMLDQFVELK